jgi:hypothetical protein
VILKLFLVFILAGYAAAADADPSPKAIIEKTTFKFSPVIAGTEVTHRFKIHNKGDEVLNIPGVYAGWGCLAVSYSRQIPPGGTGEITLKVKTEGEAGKKINQQATVYTDDPNKATIELTLTGDVLAAADIDPKVARLIGQAGDHIQTLVTITPPAINKFDIVDMKVKDGANIRFKMEKKAGSDPLSYILNISNIKPDPGRYFDKITLITTSTISPEIDIRVFGIIREKTENH